MKPVNAALHEYEDFYQELDGIVVIKIGDLDWVYKCVGGYHSANRIGSHAHNARACCVRCRWREEPEQLLRDAGKPAMTQAELRDFIDRYMPAYKLYIPALYEDPGRVAALPDRRLWSPSSSVASVPRLVMEIDRQRQPAAQPVEFNFASTTIASLE